MPINANRFDEQVAAVTGQSVSSVRRSKAIANAFTEVQLEVFVQMGTNQTDMTTIAKIKDEGKRAEVVNLIASGMVPAEAIKEAMGGEALVRGVGAPKALPRRARKQRTPLMEAFGVSHNDYETLRDFCDNRRLTDDTGRPLKGKHLRVISCGLAALRAVMKAPVRRPSGGPFGYRNAYRLDVLLVWQLVHELRSNVSAETLARLTSGSSFRDRTAVPPPSTVAAG